VQFYELLGTEAIQSDLPFVVGNRMYVNSSTTLWWPRHNCKVHGFSHFIV